ncbi:MAG: hypothetical protein OES57_01085 [Acidimicrobiia bacterium]|nr:hypothetical protein [Acidimicrobiia bacterium]
MVNDALDPERYEWLEVGNTDAPYPIHHWLSVLGHDHEAGTLDMLIRFDAQGGHCHAHRHITTTSVLVLQGEQHLEDMLPNGDRVAKVRVAGEHHLTTGDPHPHLERGGPDGALVFYSHHAPDGRLYELVDPDGRPVAVVSIESLLDTWENRPGGTA